MDTLTKPRTHFVVFTISACLTEQEALDLEKAFQEHGKRALDTFNLNDPEKEIVFTWNFFERKK